MVTRLSRAGRAFQQITTNKKMRRLKKTRQQASPFTNITVTQTRGCSLYIFVHGTTRKPPKSTHAQAHAAPHAYQQLVKTKKKKVGKKRKRFAKVRIRVQKSPHCRFWVHCPPLGPCLYLPTPLHTRGNLYHTGAATPSFPTAPKMGRKLPKIWGVSRRLNAYK